MIKFVLFRKNKHELIARDETIKLLHIKLSEANKYIETMKFTSKEMTHESIDIISTERKVSYVEYVTNHTFQRSLLKATFKLTIKAFIILILIF